VSGFAEYATLSRRSLVKIDPDLPFAEAALFGCAVITGVGAVVKTAALPPGTSIAVVGLGGVGLSALLAGLMLESTHMIAIDLNEGSYLGSCVPSRDIPRCVDWYRSGRLPVDRLLSERLALTDLNTAFDRLASGESIRQVVEIP